MVLSDADGDMAIGWILVNGVWYYLNPMAGVLDPGGNPIPEGAMYVSAVTPDGYHVGVSGALIGKITDSGRYLKRYLPLFLVRPAGACFKG